MFIVRPKQLDAMKVLFQKCIDGQYIIIDQSDGFADIAQYSSRFNTIKLVSVRYDALNKNNELKIG